MTGRRRGLLAGAVLALLLWAGAAGAHQVGLSRGGYHFDGQTVTAVLHIQGEEAARAGLSPVGVGEVDRQADTVWHVSVGGDRCAPASFEVRSDPDAPDGALVTASWRCPGEAAEAVVELVAFDRLTQGHRHLAHLDRDASTLSVLSASERELRVPRTADARARVAAPVHDAPAADTAGDGTARPKVTAPEPEPAGALAVFGGMVLMGVEHILTGYDHLLFLLGLLLICGRLRDMAKVITAFTLAHSVTLALAALHVWAPSGAIVEPAIALSVAFVGVENFIKPDPSGRWRIAGAFGLIHGFGFAGALGDVGLPPGNTVAALAGFNIGVELGQLAIMVLVVPVIAIALKQRAYIRYVMPALSGVVVLAGLGWFVQRVVG
ncbi:MAG: HupE/UreJ family protein [Deltaproteobacteria bacterium]|nr:HupE/UreJ family protein [Deltaproteobacteria bacterium]